MLTIERIDRGGNREELDYDALNRLDQRKINRLHRVLIISGVISLVAAVSAAIITIIILSKSNAMKGFWEQKHQIGALKMTIGQMTQIGAIGISFVSFCPGVISTHAADNIGRRKAQREATQAYREALAVQEERARQRKVEAEAAKLPVTASPKFSEKLPEGYLRKSV